VCPDHLDWRTAVQNTTEHEEKVGFNIGGFIEGAVEGFLETGNPYVAGAMGLYDGLTQSSSQNTNLDSILQTGQNSTSLNSLLNYAQLADAGA
jgi:hypothetical protein